jgi:double-stranded uracil-DNA glycosylase
VAAHVVASAAARAWRTPQRGLPPVIAADARVLILGSFPSVASLAAGRYYAHPRNHFWPLLSAVLDEPLTTLDYVQRLGRLRARGIGLWDTIVACRRQGSLDASIRDPQRAEVDEVRSRAPRLRAVCFNGGTSARAEPAWRGAGYATLALPSSSPAYTLPFAKKLQAWQALATWL